MKAALLAILVAADALCSAADLFQRNCNGNNCAREVTGTRAGLLPISSREADCSSFLRTTVIPRPDTTTITVTATPASSKNKRKPARNIVARNQQTSAVNCQPVTITPTSIPPYASSCTDCAEYSSVCSCWGISATTCTASKGTVTATVTVTPPQCDEL